MIIEGTHRIRRSGGFLQWEKGEPQNLVKSDRASACKVIDLLLDCKKQLLFMQMFSMICVLAQMIAAFFLKKGSI